MRYTPHVPLEGTPTVGPPPAGFQVERPRSPSGASPVFGRDRRSRDVACVDDVTRRGVLRSRPDAARRRQRRGVLRGDARRRAGRHGRSPASACCTGCSTRIGETLPSMALARQAAALAKGRPRAAVQAAGRGGRRAAGSDGAAVRRAGVRRSTARRAGRWCWPPPRRTTWSSRSPTCSGSTTSSPPATASTPTAPTTARSPARSCGRRASSPPSASGPTSTASTSTRATPTPTACTTRRCSRRSASRSWSTPTRGWWSSQRPGAGRCSTSTCRRV